MRRVVDGDIMVCGIKQNFLAAAAECIGDGCTCDDAAFAEQQIRRMPFVLRAGAGLLAFVFRVEVFVRTGGRFALLPLAMRREQWQTWQQSRMRAKRDLVALCAGLMVFSRFSRRVDGCR